MVTKRVSPDAGRLTAKHHKDDAGRFLGALIAAALKVGQLAWSAAETLAPTGTAFTAVCKRVSTSLGRTGAPAT